MARATISSRIVVSMTSPRGIGVFSWLRCSQQSDFSNLCTYVPDIRDKYITQVGEILAIGSKYWRDSRRAEAETHRLCGLHQGSIRTECLNFTDSQHGVFQRE
jgi:hypothetical protein